MRACNADTGIIYVDASRRGRGIELAINRRNEPIDVMPMLTGDQFGRQQSDKIEQSQRADTYFRRRVYGNLTKNKCRQARSPNE